MAGKRQQLTTRLSVIMTPKRTEAAASASTLADLLMHDVASRNAALRAQIDQQAKTIRDIHQNEVENQKLSKIMDEYKRRNTELVKENGKLLIENERLKRELSSKISKKLEDLNDQTTERERRVEEQKEQLTFIETQYRNLAEYMLNGETKFRNEVQMTKETYEQKTKELEHATKEYHRLMHLQDKDEIVPSNLTHFVRQKGELLDLADERVRQLKVKEEEADVLKKRIRELHQTIARLRDEKVSMARMFPAKPPASSSAVSSSFRRPSSASDAAAQGQGRRPSNPFHKSSLS